MWGGSDPVTAGGRPVENIFAEKWFSRLLFSFMKERFFVQAETVRIP
jgi:hypothetical protein